MGGWARSYPMFSAAKSQRKSLRGRRGQPVAPGGNPGNRRFTWTFHTDIHGQFHGRFTDDSNGDPILILAPSPGWHPGLRERRPTGSQYRPAGGDGETGAPV